MWAAKPTGTDNRIGVAEQFRVAPCLPLPRRCCLCSKKTMWAVKPTDFANQLTETN
jgi:uncharacterized protein (DUF1499 family)